MDSLVKFFIVLCFLELAFAADDRSRCPPTVRESRSFVKTYNNNCYMFVNLEKYWDEARAYCWKLGGEMLYVPDDKTMQFVKTTLNSRELGWTNNGVWNGASDLRGKGWEWTNGKSLSYQFWAEGEPSKTLGFLSVENCCCMRRGDGWRWHDYHCHWLDYEYNFICQFPMSNTETFTDTHTNDGAPLLEGRSDHAALIGLIIAGTALLIVFCVAVLFLYRKHERQKRELEKRHQRHVIRFQNTGYATIMQDVSHDSGSMSGDLDQPVRPVSNIYLDPVEVTRVYDEVNKSSNITGSHNFANSSDQNITDVSETVGLVYTGGASSAGDLASAGLLSASPSEAAGATSGSCPDGKRSSTESEYVEMSGVNSLESDSSLIDVAPANTICSVDDLKSWKGGANGSNTDIKASNVYVTPDMCDKKLNNCSPLANGKPKNPEIHIYSNRLDELDSSLRPLPPLPISDSIPVKNID